MNDVCEYDNERDAAGPMHDWSRPQLTACNSATSRSTAGNHPGLFTCCGRCAVAYLFCSQSVKTCRLKSKADVEGGKGRKRSKPKGICHITSGHLRFVFTWLILRHATANSHQHICFALWPVAEARLALFCRFLPKCFTSVS